MKKIWILSLSTIVLFLSFTKTANAQSQISAEEIKAEKSNLLIRKSELTAEKEELKSDIDKLTTQLHELEIKLEDAMVKYYVRKYGKEDGSRIAMGQIWKGMTEQMMRDSWGDPDKKNTDKYSYGVFTQYYYGKVVYFFRDGKLIDWEEAK